MGSSASLIVSLLSYSVRSRDSSHQSRTGVTFHIQHQLQTVTGLHSVIVLRTFDGPASSLHITELLFKCLHLTGDNGLRFPLQLTG